MRTYALYLSFLLGNETKIILIDVVEESSKKRGIGREKARDKIE